MARVLYGVCGDGSGHSSRAKIIIEHLLARRHKVQIISYDRGYENMRQNFPVEKIAGLNLIYRGNSVQYLETAVRNLARFHKLGASLAHTFKLIKKFRPQIAITDFEPLTALACHLKRIPLISIDNQHILTNTRVAVPAEYRQSAFWAKQVVRRWIGQADAFLITSFFQSAISRQNSWLFPPILRQEVLTAKSEVGDHYLVYSTSRFDRVLGLLARVPAKFLVYGLSETESSNSNIILKRPGQNNFLEDLRTCRAVIATAGFSLISEALHLGKPYLAMPVNKQFEQTINAYYLNKLGYGHFARKPRLQDIELFLANLPQYENNLKTYLRQDNSLILAKVDHLIKKMKR